MREEAEAWMVQAEHDLTVAEKNAGVEEPAAAAFFCQQAVEKAFKAVLVDERSEYPRTHSVRELGSLVDVPDRFIDLLTDLDTVYTASRYPDTPDVNLVDVETIIEQTRKVLTWTKKR